LAELRYKNWLGLVSVAGLLAFVGPGRAAEQHPEQGLRALILKIHSNIDLVSEVSNSLEQSSGSLFDVVRRQKVAISSIEEPAAEVRGSKHITKSVMLMTDRVLQIAAATKGQTASSEAIHETLKVFSELTEKTDQRATALREIVSTLSERSRQLEREISRFVTE